MGKIGQIWNIVTILSGLFLIIMGANYPLDPTTDKGLVDGGPWCVIALIAFGGAAIGGAFTYIIVNEN